MVTTNASESSQVTPQDKPTTATSILRHSTESHHSNNGGITIGTAIKYEGAKPSRIHSSSYLSDTRYSPQSQLLQESSQMKIINAHEEEKSLLREQKVTGKLVSPGRRLLSSLLGKNGEEGEEDDEEAYSTFVIPKLNADDRKKHRNFFTQLDETDDDESVPAVDSSTDETQETINSLINPVSQGDKSVHDTLQEHGVESFSTFVQRMYCGCMGTEMEEIDSDERPKGVSINPVVTVYSIHGPMS